VPVTWGFGQYVSAFGRYDVTYGSLGGILILLTWLYLSGLIALAGGQLSAAVAQGSAAANTSGAHETEDAGNCIPDA
jgi:membrane protein